jgi:hypothetical protein
MLNIALRLSNCITRHTTIAQRLPRLPQLLLLTTMLNIAHQQRLITTLTLSIARQLWPFLPRTPLSNIAHHQRLIITLIRSIVHRNPYHTPLRNIVLQHRVIITHTHFTVPQLPHPQALTHRKSIVNRAEFSTTRKHSIAHLKVRIREVLLSAVLSVRLSV